MAATCVCKFVPQKLPRLPECVDCKVGGETLQNLLCEREMSNPHDIYAVIVMKGKQIVGHLPYKTFSSYLHI